MLRVMSQIKVIKYWLLPTGSSGFYSGLLRVDMPNFGTVLFELVDPYFLRRLHIYVNTTDINTVNTWTQVTTCTIQNY